MSEIAFVGRNKNHGRRQKKKQNALAEFAAENNKDEILEGKFRNDLFAFH